MDKLLTFLKYRFYNDAIMLWQEKEFKFRESPYDLPDNLAEDKVVI